MSNTSSITQWLDHLIDLLPPSAIRLVGAGNGSGIWAQWLAAHGQVAATLVEANPQQFAALQRQQAAGNWGQASLLNTVIAPSAGEVDFFTASLTAESGLLPAEELRAVWPNVHTAATERRAATDLAALLQVDAEPSANQQWLLLDCLPAAALLRSAQAQLQHVDVVVARVLQAGDSIPSLSGMGVSLEDVSKALPGFRLLALQPGRHPALAHALFVRDYRSIALQIQADLQARLTQAQAEKADLLKKQEQLTQAQQALQADLTKVSQERDAEVKAKQALLMEAKGIQKSLGKQAEEIEKIKRFMATKGDLNNVAKQLQSFISLENYWESGELPTANTEKHAWPVSPDFSLYMVSLLEQNDYDMVIEFGSGVSTLVTAKALKKMEPRRAGKNPVVFISFDHLQKYYQQTLEMLQQAGLAERVQLKYAPLQAWKAANGKIYPYYACQKILQSIAEKYSASGLKILVVVDGPPGNTGPHARYPAVPLMLESFPKADIDILLDDYVRQEEKEIAKLWQEDFVKTERQVHVVERKLEKDACLIKTKFFNTDKSSSYKRNYLGYDESLFFNRCTFIDKAGRKSNDFMELCFQNEHLNFNKKYLDPKFKDWQETPFEEISIQTPSNKLLVIKEFTGAYEEFLRLLIDSLKNILMRMDPNEKYIFSHSSGSDSRIIAGAMAELKKEGKASFDNVLFYCWGSQERESFLELMHRGGWSNIAILNDRVANPYGVGYEYPPVDGWNNYTSQMKFWGDIDPSEYILLTGAEGEIFSKPYEEWVHAHGYFDERGETIHRFSKIFKGVFAPYLSYEFLGLVMSMPQEWRNIPDKRLGRDKVRTDLVEMLGGSLDIPIQPNTYNFNFSENDKKRMIDLWQKSKFRKDFGVELNFENVFGSGNWNSWDSRAWSFGVTVYERLHREGKI